MYEIKLNANLAVQSDLPPHHLFITRTFTILSPVSLPNMPFQLLVRLGELRRIGMLLQIG